MNVRESYTRALEQGTVILGGRVHRMRGDGTIACPDGLTDRPKAVTARPALNLLSAVLGKETSGPVNARAHSSRQARFRYGVSERFMALPIRIRRGNYIRRSIPFVHFLIWNRDIRQFLSAF